MLLQRFDHSMAAVNSWSSRGPDLASVASVAVSPIDDATVLAASSRIFRTTDSGQTWAPSDAGLPVVGGRLQASVYEIAFAPSVPSRVYAATSSGVAKSDDGGVNWLMLAGSPTAAALVVHPGDGDTLFIASHSGRVARSSDGGASWSSTTVSAQATVVDLVIAAGDPSRLYAGTTTGVFRSDDAGATWSAASAGLPAFGQYPHVNGVVVDHGNPNIVYAAVFGFGVHRSIDGGNSWTVLTNASVAETLVMHPQNPSILLSGPAGPYRTTNAGAQWQLVSAGMAPHNAGALAFSPSNPQVVYAGTRGGGVFRSADGGATWASRSSGIRAASIESLVYAGGRVVAGGPGGVASIAPADPEWVRSGPLPYLGGGGTVRGLAYDTIGGALYGAVYGAGLVKSVDGGVTWLTKSQGINSGGLSDVIVDPSAAGTAYAMGQSGVFKTTNGGDQWVALAGLPGSGFRNLAIDPEIPLNLYVGTAAGLFVSSDGGAAWVRAPGLPATDVTAVATAPGGNVYVATSGNVYRSIDSGAAWSPLGSQVFAKALAADPSEPGTLWAGTSNGVWAWDEGSGSWQAIGLAATDVQKLLWVPETSTLFAGTRVTGVQELTPAYTLSVTVTGPGTVSASAPPISCPGTCSAEIVRGVVMSLTASPASGSEFTGWSGACTGTGTCQVTMNGARSVSATFRNPAPSAAGAALSTNEDIPVSGLLNATDPHGEPLTFSIVGNGTLGTAVITDAATGAFTYTPNANASGTDGFTFRASDGTSHSNVATVAVTIDPVNDPPVAVNGTLSVLAGGSANAALVATDVDGPALSYSIATNGTKGTAVVTNPQSGAYTYTANPNTSGTDTVTFTASDGLSTSNVAAVAITITPAPAVGLSVGALNFAKQLVGSSSSAPRYSVGSWPSFVAAADVNSDGAVDLVSANQQSQNVSVLLNTGSGTFAPAVHYPTGGTYSTAIAVRDFSGDGALDLAVTNQVTRDVSVLLGNGAGAFGAAVRYPAGQGGSAGAFGITAGDFNTDGDVDLAVGNSSSAINVLLGNGDGTFAAGGTFSAANALDVATGDFNGDGRLDLATGAAVLLGNGNGSFQPAVGLTGSGDFLALADYNRDGRLDVAIGSRGNPSTVRIRLGNGNGTFTAGGTFPVGRAPFFMSAADLNGDGAPDLAVASEFDGSASVLLGNGDGSFGAYTNYGYHHFAEGIAIADLNGDERLDLAVASATGRTVGVVLGNGDGTFRASQTVTVQNTGNAPLHLGTLTFAGTHPGDFFVEARACPAALDPQSACIIVVGFRPTASGARSATLQINSDANGSPHQVMLTGAGAVAPVAQNLSVSTTEDTATTGQLTATDADGDSVAFTLVANGTRGIAVITDPSTGAFTYTPQPNAAGTDTFTFKADDGSFDSNVATVTVSIAPVNDPPVAVGPDSATTAEDTAVQVRPADNDTDPDGATGQFTITAVTQPANGTVTQSGTHTLLYTPAANFNGSDSFTYTITDTGGASAAGTVQVTVTPVDDAPVAAADTYATAEDTPLTIAAAGVLANDTDPDGPALTAAIAAGPAHGSVTLNANGSFTYTPAVNYNGPDAFTYRATGGALASDVATVSINVSAVNDAPVASSATLAAVEDVPAAGTLAASDVEGQPLTYGLVAPPGKGRLALNPATGAFTYTPLRNATGADAFAFIVSDGAAQSPAATINVTIAAVNDTPVAIGQSAFVLEDSSTPLRLGATDADGDTLTFEIVSTPGHGTVSGTAPDVVYTPAANYNGPDSFTFRVSDGSASQTATVEMTVTPMLWTARGPEPGGVGTLAISPSHPSVLYGGSFRTLDGGATWTRPYAQRPWNSAPNVIAVDPHTPTTAYGAAAQGIFKTIDGGATWTLQNSGIIDLVNATRTVAVDPTAPGTVYAVAGERTYKSTDGAATWTLSDNGLSSVAHRFAIDPSAPSIVYAGTSNGVFKSIDGGANWVSSSIGLGGSLVQALAIDPQNPATLYAGTFGAGVFKSTNGGATWASSNAGITDNNLRTFAINPSSPSTVYVSTASGVFRTVNGGASWSPLNNGLPPPLSGYQLAIDPLSPSTLYAASSTVYKTTNGGATWAPTGSGLVAASTFGVTSDGGDPETVYAADRRGVYRSTNHASTWSATASLGTIPQVIAVDPSVRSTVYAGTIAGVYKSVNSGASWSAINSGLTSLGVQGLVVNPATPSTLYASTTTGGVFKSTNAGGSWSAANSGLSGLNVRMVTIDPLAPDTLYATNNVVFKSVNGGVTWTTANSGLPGVVWTLAASPTTPGVVYAGTSNGVYKTSNGGASWTAMSSGLPAFTSIPALAIDPVSATLYAGTISGDVFKLAAGSASWQSISVGLQGGGINALAVSADTAGRLYASAGGIYVFDQAANDAPIAIGATTETPEDTAVNISLTATDGDGETLAFNIVSPPAHGTLSGTAPNLTYTPAPNYHGADGFTFTASDGTDTSSPATVTITVSPVNDAPLAANDAFTTAEDATLTVSTPGVLANDSDADGDPLSPVVLTGPAHGTVTLNVNGSFTYVPATNYYGADGFTYSVSDGAATSGVATVTIAVTAVNDVPVATASTLTVTEDVPAVGTLTALDADGDTLIYSRVANPTKGKVVITNASTGGFVYTPLRNAVGNDAFTFVVSDGTAQSAVATVSVTIAPADDAPVAHGQTAFVLEDTEKPITVRGSDPEGGTLTFAIVSGPSHGTLSGVAPNLVYTPAANYNGPDGFDFSVEDAAGGRSVATVRLTVAPEVWAGTGPHGGSIRHIAIDPSIPSIMYAATTAGIMKSTDGGVTWYSSSSGLTTANILVVTIDPATPTTLYAGSSVVAGGSVFKSRDGGATWQVMSSGLPNGAASVLIVDPATPGTLYVALGSGVFKSVDGGTSWTARSAGLPAGFVGALAMDPVTPGTLYAGTSGGVFKSVDAGATWAASTTGLPGTGISKLVVDPDAPAAIYAATSTGLFKTTNGGGTWAAAGLNQTIVSVAVDPLDSQIVYAGTFNGLFRSVNGGASWTPASSGLGGDVDALAIHPLTPATIYAGTPRGVFKTTNSGGTWLASSNGLTSLLIMSVAFDQQVPPRVYAAGRGVFRSTDEGATWTPTANGLSPSILVEQLVVNPLDPNVIHARTSAGLYKTTNAGTNWTATPNGINSQVFALAMHPAAPTTLFAGTATGVFKSTDGAASWTAASTGLGNLSVRALAVDPAAPATVYAGTPGGVFRSTDGGNTWAPRSNGLTVTSVSQLLVDPASPASLFVVAGNGAVFRSTDAGATWVGVPNALPAGATLRTLAIDPAHVLYASTFQGVFRSTDGGTQWRPVGVGLINPDVLSVAIDPQDPSRLYASSSAGVFVLSSAANDAPLAESDQYNATEDAVLAVPSSSGLLVNDTDIDGEPLTAQLVTAPAHGTLALGADGAFTYTPHANYHGSDSFTYVARDGSAASAATTVTISISSVNDAPAAEGDSHVTNLNTPLTVGAPGVLGNDSDVDGDALTAAVVTGPAHGALTLSPDGAFTYTPSLDFSGPDSFTYQVSDGLASSSPVSVSLTVTAPVVSLSASTLAFGNQLLFIASAAQPIALSNTGDGPLAIDTLTISGANASDFARSTTCGATLAPGATCTIDVVFTPAIAGVRTATLQVATNAVGGARAVALSGTGIKGDTTTTLSSAPNPSSFTQPVTLTATIAAVAPSSGTPTGTVQFFDGATMIASAPVAANGTATTVTSGLLSGTHTLTAAYGGDANFNASTSGAETHTVQSTAASTQTTLTSSPNPSALHEFVVLDAVVAPLSGSVKPGGLVEFFDGTTSLGVATLVASQGKMRAQLPLSFDVAGSHTLTARYAGDASFAGSTSPVVAHSVYQGTRPMATTTTVTSSPNPSVPGQSVTFTATVTARRVQVTGMVQFYADGVAVGQPVALVSPGRASIQIANLSVGFHTVTAHYLGTATFAGSTGSTTQFVQ